MIKTIKRQRLLILITLVALGFRLWHLGSLPAILNRDEAALAYNALLLAETGQDEWQRRWPLALESFGDYKLLGYPALLIPLFKLFSPTDYLVRLPSALFGTMLVPLTYWLAKSLKAKNKLALFASLVTALSPVFIWYSRMAFEANLALTYLAALLVVLFEFARQAKPWHAWALTALIFLGIFTYNTPLLLLPVLMIFAGLLFTKKQSNKFLLVELIFALALIVGLLILAPTTAQKSSVTIFNDETTWYHWTVFRASLTGVWQTLLANRYVYYAGLIVKNLFFSFSPQFLVINGGAHPWHSLPTSGHLFASTYVLSLLGIGQMLVKIFINRTKLISVRLELAWLWLLFASLLPSIVTVDAPHATRSLLFFLLFCQMAIFGLQALLKKLPAKLVWTVVFVIVGVEALNHVQEFGKFINSQHDWQPGFEQVVQQVEATHPSLPVEIVDPAGYHYILLAWYLKLPAKTYFDTIIRQDKDAIGFRYGQQLSHYHFIAKEIDRVDSESILIQWSKTDLNWQVKEDL